MSRISLIFLLLFSQMLYGQDFQAERIAFADDMFEKQDYPEAIKHYRVVLNQDSSLLDVRWKYAECLRLTRDYRAAEVQYGLIYDEEKTSRYPRSLFYLAEMHKYNGKYDEAIELFKDARKKYMNDRKGYLYQKSKQEIESCLWAKKALRDTGDLKPAFMPAPYNSPDSEFGHTIRGQQFYFSALKEDSLVLTDDVYARDKSTGLYAATLPAATNLVPQNSIRSAGKHTANGTFSLDKKRFYYSSCQDFDHAFQCKIVMAYVVGDKLLTPDTLGEIINEEDANTTMPHITRFEGKEVLFFASDRNGGHGGLDIYYSFIDEDGSRFSKPKAVDVINSPDNELTPFLDTIDHKLYFASNWFYGFGGYDIFASDYEGTKFKDPVNPGIPINSSANDFYLFRHHDSVFFTTNRIGVQYRHNPTCCTDIMSYVLPPPPPPDVVVNQQTGDTSKRAQPRFTSLQDMNRKMPITLYFHNDIPDPRSVKPTTHVNYVNSYNDYIAMIPEYRREYAKGLSGDKASEAEEDISNFFTEYVEQGMKDLLDFQVLLLEELKRGSSLVLTVKGFASPLAKTDYNVNLTKRRIASLVNYLREYGSGEFKPYLDGTAPNGAKLSIQEVPFGEYQAAKLTSDNPNDLKNSVYSRAAAIERKIEIQSVTFLKRDSVHYLVTKQQVQDLGKIDPSKTYTRTYEVVNDGPEPIEIEQIRIPCDCNTATISKKILAPQEKAVVTMTFDPKGYTGMVVKSVYLHVKGAGDPLRLVITGEIKP